MLRLVLADAIRIYFAYTAYTVLSYLHVRPSLAATLERTPAAIRVAQACPWSATPWCPSAASVASRSTGLRAVQQPEA